MAGDAPVANSLKTRSFLSFFPSPVKDKYFASAVGVLLPLSQSEEPVMVFRGLLLLCFLVFFKEMFMIRIIQLLGRNWDFFFFLFG